MVCQDMASFGRKTDAGENVIVGQHKFVDNMLWKVELDTELPTEPCLCSMNAGQSQPICNFFKTAAQYAIFHDLDLS